MVRADPFDAVDTILRVYRKKEAVPFGGVQVLLSAISINYHL